MERRVLLIEDEPTDAAWVQRCFRSEAGRELDLEHVATLSAGIQRLARGNVDAVLLDLKLPDSQGIDGVTRIRQADPALPIVVFTGADDDDTAIAALDAGAQDYLVKDERREALLRRAIHAAIERSRIARDGARLAQRLHEVERRESLGALCAGIGWGFSPLIGTIFDRCDQALASLDAGGGELQLRTALIEIHRVAFRAAEMIQRLRDYAEIERAASGEVDLVAFALETSDFLGAVVPSGIEISYQTTGGPLVVDATRPELHRILVGLVVNAAEAIGTDRGSIAISTGVLHPDAALLAEAHGWSDPKPVPHAYLRVADTGRGLDAAAGSRIFEPFYTTKLAGRGLGLAGIAGILSRRRAVVHVQPNRPAGTVFTVLFPRSG